MGYRMKRLRYPRYGTAYAYSGKQHHPMTVTVAREVNPNTTGISVLSTADIAKASKALEETTDMQTPAGDE